MYADRLAQMPWRAERTKGHGSDCVCEFCFLAPPLPTVADNLDALTEIVTSLRRIEKLLTERLVPPLHEKPLAVSSPSKTPESQGPNFL